MNNISPAEGAPAGPASFTGGGMRSHAILIILCLLYVSDYANRYVVSSMLGFIQADWGISDAQGGWLMSIVLLFITIFAIPASILIDRWSRRKMISIMVFLWSLATLSCAFTKSFAQLLVARAFLGIGEAGYAPAGSALLSAAYPEGKRARVMGIWNGFIPLGVGLGLAGGGLIAKYWGWQNAFGLMAVPGVMLAVMAWFLPDYKTVRTGDTGVSFGREYLRNAGGQLRIPSQVLAYHGLTMNVSITTAVMHWLPIYFERTGTAEPGQGGIFAMPFFALVLVGAPLGGFIADAWMKRRRNARMILPAITSFLAAIALFLAFLQPGETLQIPTLVLYGIVVTCFIAPAIAVTQDVVHPGLRALSFALCVIVQHILGDVWSPALVGKLSDMMGLEKAMLVIPIYGIFAAIFFIIGSRFYARDLDRVEKVSLEAE